jgi:hypothetical protein
LEGRALSVQVFRLVRGSFRVSVTDFGRVACLCLSMWVEGFRRIRAS